MVLVDGLQRLSAVRAFISNNLKVFALYYSEYEGYLSSTNCLTFNITNLKTEQDVINFYLTLNAGGTPHKQDELKRVTNLLKGDNIKQEWLNRLADKEKHDI